MNDWLVKLFPNWTAWKSFWSTLEFGREVKTWWVVGFAGLFLAALWLYRRDTRALHPFWKIWLWGLRLAVILALLVVALVPQERKSEVKALHSEVVILADTSVSMTRQDADAPARAGTTSEKRVPSRSELVKALLEKSPLVSDLRKTHDVHIETFDSELVRHQLLQKWPAPKSIQSSGSAAHLQDADTSSAAIAASSQTPQGKPLDWGEILRPRGSETRLGEALLAVIREESGDTLSGIVVITDGGNNAGVDPLTAAEAAVANKVRLIAVGVGSTKKPVLLQLAEIQAPTHVHINDGFAITAFVTGHGLARQMIEVELSTRLEQDEGEFAVIQT
ncbi:MAG TPA: VWA domain-containing protein, partial [Planctomycetaceae bacterium]|nr:VWA domain-containing protein [Planctomycetaceae bacterium]